MPRKIAIIAHSPGRTQDFNWLGILKLIVWAVTVALGAVGHKNELGGGFSPTTSQGCAVLIKLRQVEISPILRVK